MKRVKDLTGQKFGRLTVIERAENHIQPSGQQKTQWLCKCDCGKDVKVQTYKLINGIVRSCGCYRIEQTKQRETVHGMSKTNIFSQWVALKQRCINPNNKSYKNYGGRGIAICDRWLYSFENYYEDVSKLPHFGKKGYTLDRIDNNGNYEPDNVRWATAEQQANNNRHCCYIIYNGERYTLSELSKKYNVAYDKLKQRLHKYNWTIERALNTP